MDAKNAPSSGALAGKTLLILAWLSGVGTAQELVSNGSFEENTCNVSSFLSLSAGETCLTDWTITGGGIEYVKTVWNASDGDCSVELADSSAAGGVEQVLGATLPGQQYRVAFDLAGQPNGATQFMRVEVDNGQSADFSFNTAGQSVSDMGWQRKEWCFTATSATTTLTFLSTNTASAFHAAIDNVSVVPANQDLVRNGSFEDNTCNVSSFLSLEAGETCLTDWSVLGDGIELVHTSWVSSDGDYSVELADLAQAGGLEQVLDPTVIGQEYRVSFELAGQTDGNVQSLRVEVDSGQGADFSFDTAGQTPADMGWVLTEWFFTATSTSTTLTFLATDVTTAFNAAIDNVSVVPVGENLVSNGSFEQSSCTVGSFQSLEAGETCLTDWSVLGGGIEYVQTVWVSPDGDFSVELTDGSQAGGVEQILSPTIVGQAYRVSFKLAGQPNGLEQFMRVEVDNGQGADFSFDTAGQTGTDMGWQATEWFFTATSTSTTLTFLATNVTTAFNAAIDDVRVERATNCVWFDEGCALAGVSGDPLLVGAGPLTAGSPNSVELVNAAPNAIGLLFISLTKTPVPLFGGILKPFPAVTIPILITEPDGTRSFPFLMPPLPAGTDVWFQWIIQDAAGPFGASMSNALLGVAQ